MEKLRGESGGFNGDSMGFQGGFKVDSWGGSFGSEQTKTLDSAATAKPMPHPMPDHQENKHARTG